MTNSNYRSLVRLQCWFSIIVFISIQVLCFASSATSDNSQLRSLITLGTEEGKKTLAPLEMSELFRGMYYNPVARLDMVRKYDPAGLIGFCFGRSMTGAIEASQLGLDFSKMSNVFIVGDLKRPGTTQTEWRFHVTFVAPDNNGALWAFDPIHPHLKPVPLYFWVKFVRQTWDPQEKARLYKTSAFAVMPDTREMIMEGRDWPLLIDLDFDPNQHTGFRSNTTLVPGQEIFEVSNLAERKNFLTLHENDPNPFSMNDLTIVEGPVISYNNYFYDLIGTYPNGQLAPNSMVIASSPAKSSQFDVPASSTRAYSIPAPPKPDSLYRVPGVDAPLVEPLVDDSALGGFSGQLDPQSQVSCEAQF